VRKIEINTPQNVPLQYQLANVRERAMAFVFDFLIQFFYFLIVILALGTALFDDIEQISLLFWVISILPVVFYSFLFESFMNGQTPGKAMLKIRVHRMNGEALELTDLLLRWLFRWLDIWLSSGALAALQVSSSLNGQRTGDLLAGTTVLRMQPDFQVKLDDLLRLKSDKDHEVQFPEVWKFKEDEMLLIKQTLDRVRRNNNAAHRKLLEGLSRSVANRLGLTQIPADQPAFLQTVILDYVTLTRS